MEPHFTPKVTNGYMQIVPEINDNFAFCYGLILTDAFVTHNIKLRNASPPRVADAFSSYMVTSI